jgi:hypothetical protein
VALVAGAAATKPGNQAKTVAVGCERLRRKRHGKEEVDRSVYELNVVALSKKASL